VVTAREDIAKVKPVARNLLPARRDLLAQWQDVDLETRELTIRAEKAKTAIFGTKRLRGSKRQAS
jgi:hypothetical protein